MLSKEELDGDYNYMGRETRLYKEEIKVLTPETP